MYNQMEQPNFDENKGGVPPNDQQPPGYSQQPMGQPPQPTGQPPQPMAMASYPPQPGYGPPPQQGGYPQQSHMSSTNTTVVIQQPQTQVVMQGPRQWTTGICSCFDDCGVCLLVICCPSIADCKLSGAAGECCCVASMCPIALRTKIRTTHSIQGSIVGDCCMMMCCGVCAKCQMQREINIHGI